MHNVVYIWSRPQARYPVSPLVWSLQTLYIIKGREMPAPYTYEEVYK